MTKWVYTFGDGKAEGNAKMRNELGGKGANLAEMSSIGVPVPPGFTITTEACVYYYKNNKAYSDRNFEADIEIDRSIITDQIMPEQLGESDVLCLDEPIAYTYTMDESRYSSHILIPQENIQGNITINVSLVTPEKFQIVLDANAGQFEGGAQTMPLDVLMGVPLKYLTGYQRPDHFRDGYHFTHWELSTDREEKLNENDLVPFNPGATYIANGERNAIEVEINPDGGTFEGKTPGEHLILNTLYDTVINDIDGYISEPKKEGYTFLYYEDVNLKHYLPTDTVTIPGLTLGLKAVYSKDLKITLNAGEGAFSDESKEKSFNSYSGITLSKLNGYEDPKVTGKEFTYWTINGDPNYYYKNTELNFEDRNEITLTANFYACGHDTFSEYTVIDNQLYGICAKSECKAQILISDVQLASGAYDNKFLLYNN